ncbi:MAG: hypothetical protein ACP5O1_04570 [Phycisphaerae bacterium]
MEVEKNRLLPAESPTVAIDVILWIRRYGVYILLIFAIVVLAFELYNFWQVSKMRKIEEAWVALESASSPGAIEQTVLTVYHSPQVDAQAYLKIGRIYLYRLTLGPGFNKSHGLKATRAQAIAGAKMAFQKVIHDYPTPIVNKIAAELGLALTYEDAHEWKKAGVIYTSMLHSKKNPTIAAYVDVAKFRLNNLAHWAEPILVSSSAHHISQPSTTNTPSPAGSKSVSK